MNALPVIFRVNQYRRGLKSDATAVFPTLEGSPGEMLCYSHVGQHGSCPRGWYRTTRPARIEEYAELLDELRGIYEQGDEPVQLVVRNRMPNGNPCFTF